MFKAIQKFFTKVIQLTSNVFQPSQIIVEELSNQDPFVSSEIIEEVDLKKKTSPKIKEIKYRKSANYR